MKIAISSKGNKLNSEFDKRFGRAEWFCIWDDETAEGTFYPNEHSGAGNGAGVKAAEKMIGWGVKKVISGDFGPKAKELLEKFDIQLIILQEDIESIDRIISRMPK